MSDAATEATLRELLTSSKDMAGVIKKMAQKMGADLSGIAEAGEEGKKTGGALKKFAGVIGETILQINDFGRTAASSGIGVSALFDRLAGLIPPGKFNLLRDGLEAISSLTKEYEKNQQVYNELSQIGITFGGQLGAVSTIAGKAYMTMDQFSKVAANSADVFRMMGGTVESGMNKFVAIQNSLLDQESPFARNLAALTGGAQGTADALAGYMRTQVSMNKAEFQNIEVIKQGTLDYARELDGLSKITGKRRDQIEQEYQKTAAEESFQQFLSSLNPEEAALAAAKVRAVAATAGQDAAMQMRQALQTGIISPMTAKQGELDVVTKGAITEMIGNLLLAKTGAEIQKSTIDGLTTAGTNLNQFAIQNKEALAANASMGQGLNIESTRIIRESSNAFKTVEGTTKLIAKMSKEQEDQAKGSATSLTLAEQSITKVAAKINEIRETVLDPVVKIISDVTGKVGNVVAEVFNKDKIEKSAKSIMDGLKSLQEGLTDNIKDSKIAKILTGALESATSDKTMLGQVKNKAGKALSGTYDYLSNVLSIHFTALGNMLGSLISKITEMLPGVETLEKKIKNKENEIKRKESELEKTTSPELRSLVEGDLKKLKDEMMQLQRESETRKISSFDYNAFLLKAMKEKTPELLPEKKSESPPTVPSTNAGTTPTSQTANPDIPVSPNTPGVKVGSLPPTERYASAEQVDRLITSNKELNEILNNKLTELITVARASNDTSSKTVMAINRLNNDGFAVASA